MVKFSLTRHLFSIFGRVLHCYCFVMVRNKTVPKENLQLLGGSRNVHVKSHCSTFVVDLFASKNTSWWFKDLLSSFAIIIQRIYRHAFFPSCGSNRLY